MWMEESQWQESKSRFPGPHPRRGHWADGERPPGTGLVRGLAVQPDWLHSGVALGALLPQLLTNGVLSPCLAFAEGLRVLPSSLAYPPCVWSSCRKLAHDSGFGITGLSCLLIS